MKKSDATCAPAEPTRRNLGLLWAVLTLLLVQLVLFHRSLEATRILFSSDGPLGANASAFAAMPSGYTGIWQDVNWVGASGGSAFPSLTYLLLWLLQPVGFARFYAPLSLMALGLAVWVFLRQCRFHPAVCILGSLAASLNSDFLSYACWGLGTVPLTAAATALALAALAGTDRAWFWHRAVLAGVAVGSAVIEGFDAGAIFSLYVAAFVLFQAFVQTGPGSARFGRAVGRLGLVVVLAGLTAFQALTVLISTQIKGVVGMEQDQQTKAQRWNQATQWSLPKMESLRTVIAGLYGYRMDTPAGGGYWGGVGRDPVWDDYFAAAKPDRKQPPDPRVASLRHSGAGHYAGVLVVLVGLWGVAQLWRRGNANPFTAAERKAIGFWAVAALVSLLLAFGRHAPFYQLVYALPYFSTIRNPIKFLHPLSLALVVLFAYGLEGIWRSCVAGAKPGLASAAGQLRAWWKSPANPDRRWALGSMIAVSGVLCVWLIYATSQRELVAHLQRVGFGDAAAAAAIARFSVGELGLFALLLAVAAAWVSLILSKALAGSRARWAALGTGALVALDLMRASTPWVNYWDREDKYATNPLFDILRQTPWEHRVVAFPYVVNEQLALLAEVYRADWIQHGFRYYNIQSLDVVQEPRVATENQVYRHTLYGAGAGGTVRLWELTNTRFILGLAGGFVEALNQQFDPARRRFRLVAPFNFTQGRPGGAIGAQTNAAGPFALIEFAGALPRANLYADWQVRTNDQETLRLLVDPAFDPHRRVLVSDSPLPSPTPAATNQQAGTVKITHYTPKNITLQTHGNAPAVLLLNHKHDPNWQVTLDGKTEALLRCNFLMQGVFLTPGEHTVVFRFRAPLAPLLVSTATVLAAVVLLGFLWCGSRRQASAIPASPPLAVR